MLLRTAAGKDPFLHVSYTESFFKTHGRTGKAKITGPRRSCGMEAIICDRTHPEMGSPETTIWVNPIVEFPGSRNSANSSTLLAQRSIGGPIA
jgi:hypothetical protein